MFTALPKHAGEGPSRSSAAATKAAAAAASSTSSREEVSRCMISRLEPEGNSSTHSSNKAEQPGARDQNNGEENHQADSDDYEPAARRQGANGGLGCAHQIQRDAQMHMCYAPALATILNY